MFTFFSVTAVLVLSVSASPVPVYPRQLNNSSIAPTRTLASSAIASASGPAGVVIGTTTVPKASLLCSLSPSDPASWAASGADVFLDGFLAANTSTNWLHNMDQAFYPGGPDYQSTLDCENLDGSLCPAPPAACDQFGDPEVRFIRLAATNAHDFFGAASSSLLHTTIDDILDVGQIVSDFNPANQQAQLEDQEFHAIGGGLAIARAVFNLVPELEVAGNVLGVVGAIFANLPPSQGPADISTLTNELNQQLKNVFDQGEASIAAFNSELFGGSGDFDLDSLLSTLSSAGINVADSNAQNSITKIFSSGAFLQPLDQSPLLDGIKDGLQLIKQGLVGLILKSLNYYVFIDTTLTSDECLPITGSRFFNNECHILSRRVIPDGKGETDTQPIDPSIILKFDDSTSGYNIDPDKFYENIDDCNGGTFDTSLTSVLDTSGDFPKCFFALPVIKVNGPHVCSLLPSAPQPGVPAPGTPANLDITQEGCHTNICLGFKIGGC